MQKVNFEWKFKWCTIIFNIFSNLSNTKMRTLPTFCITGKLDAWRTNLSRIKLLWRCYSHGHEFDLWLQSQTSSKQSIFLCKTIGREITDYLCRCSAKGSFTRCDLFLLRRRFLSISSCDSRLFVHMVWLRSVTSILESHITIAQNGYGTHSCATSHTQMHHSHAIWTSTQPIFYRSHIHK